MKKYSFFLILLCYSISCKDEVASAEEAVAVKEINIQSSELKDKKVAYDVAAQKETSLSTPSENTRIIKSAQLRFESNNIDETYLQIQKIATTAKATITSDISGKEYDAIFRNLTIRIPNKNFDSFIATISQGVKHFDTKEITQQDVTEEYIDVESRMLAKKKLEARYLQLLQKATKISEMLEIEKQLSAIREEIEAKEGQLNYMQNRVSFSTITIEMYTSSPTESGATISYGGKIWNAIQSGFNGLSNFLLSVLSIWPFLLIFVGLYFYIRKRFIKKKD